MKPVNLKSPFTWENRQILIQDRVWYVPHQYENGADFSFPGWTHALTFNQERPICLEYCSGNGAWIIAKAQANSEKNWVAIERKFNRVRKIWSKVKNYDLSNVLIACAEGYFLTRHYFPSASVQAVYINFPDPWPKKRHAKHRLIQVPFIEEIRRILQIGGVLTLVTDDAAYSQWMIEVVHQVSGLHSLFDIPYYVEDYPNYGTSYFEDLWRKKGKIIRYHVFRKI